MTYFIHEDWSVPMDAAGLYHLVRETRVTREKQIRMTG
jgi:hypothetical protein